MNSNTGAIAAFETRKDAEAAGFDTPLEKHEADDLILVNRKERRRRLAEMRSAEKAQRPYKRRKRK